MDKQASKGIMWLCYAVALSAVIYAGISGDTWPVWFACLSGGIGAIFGSAAALTNDD